MGYVPLGFGMVVKINRLNFHVHVHIGEAGRCGVC